MTATALKRRQENEFASFQILSRLFGSYLDAFNLSHEGDYSWSLILKDFIQVQKERGKFVVVCSRPP